MNQYLETLSETLEKIDLLLAALEKLPLGNEKKAELKTSLENAWNEVFFVYDIITELTELFTSGFNWN
ncbi:MAG: hypothetical protein A2499_02855 [Stygiobacter sp. RIFOXYC12_FULL_38_8]|nr:MAG: hypothetical protein A2299_02055 [Stygiobacter sp. RIFOXYB2_FULL_37_11]OGV15128.1 MAG: hypothetical protein A2440_07215 [Stygiobacter sp. RIFOXYC2_FULL_38_25]OGV17063.1 MAG: hypothetical protein A2237_18360 [Stygiobacter sp. RIFOXYA2_FULL_38_8]OGV27315.1 MAG: hypothetical protein A2499_02855 [Stygiobacter sp. RIFOXYC12_FULL_38_8]OGV79703.1 MAG: hypothetical protein A2X65_19300 [Stygiobacter sp. GWF2_38_21]